MGGTDVKRTMPLSANTYSCATLGSASDKYLQPTAEFLDILCCAGATKQKVVYTKNEILAYLKRYISLRTLYDPDHPQMMFCKDDPLGKVFKVDKFTIDDVVPLIYRNTKAVCQEPVEIFEGSQSFGVDEVDGASFSGAICTYTRIRRRSESVNDGIEPALKRIRSTSSLSVVCSDGDLHIPSSSDEKLSVQSKETVKIQSPFGDGLSAEDCVFDEDHMFDVEYEIAASSSDDNSNILSDGISDSVDDDDDDDSLSQEVVIVCQESDVEFWADESETDISSDLELSEKDKWSCSSCGSRNSPIQRNCIKCWEVRPGWMPEKSHYGRMPFRLQKTFHRSKSAPGDLESSLSSDSSPLNSLTKSVSNSTVFCAQHKPTSTLNVSKFACSTPVPHNLPVNISALMGRTNPQLVFDESAHLRGSGSDIVSANKDNVKSSSMVHNVNVNVLASSQSSSFDSAFGSASQGSGQLTPYTTSSQAYDEVDGLPTDNKRYSLLQAVTSLPGTSSSNTFSYTPTSLDCANSGNEKSDGNIVQTTKKGSAESYNQRSSRAYSSQKSSNTGLCSLCVTKPMNASLIHGKSGHQMCCYTCAKKLRRRGMPCPICRKPIQKIIKNYIYTKL